VAVVQATALHGLGGVGKTQLAIEYAHVNAENYRYVWWIDAEQGSLVGEKIAELAKWIGVELKGRVADDAAAVLKALRRIEDWLLIFDNADSATTIRPWLPDGHGHVLITSRSPGWGQLATSVGVDVMNRSEAVSLLRRRVADLDSTTADELAAELGDLPLALEQAAAYLEQTAVPPASYLRRFRSRRIHMLGKGRDLAYGGSVDTAWEFSLERLDRTEPAATVVLQLCAALAPEPVPIEIFADHAAILPEPLRSALNREDPLAELDDIVAHLLSYALARRRGSEIVVHRLVAQVVAAQQPRAKAVAITDAAAALLAVASPSNGTDPEHWPSWAVLGPHLLHASKDVDIADPHRLRIATHRFCWHLHARGDYAAAYDLASNLYQSSVATLGRDHPDTFDIGHILAVALSDVGKMAEACSLGGNLLTRSQRYLGDDHFTTLELAANLVYWLYVIGDRERARRLAEDTLTRCQNVLGQDAPLTLGTAHNLTYSLMDFGENGAAHALAEDTFQRRRRVLGDDHPDTLRSAADLAAILAIVHENDAAHAVAEDTFQRQRQVLGDDHPDTLWSAADLAGILALLGRSDAAHALAEDTFQRRRRVLGDDHPDTLRSAADLATIRALFHGEDGSPSSSLHVLQRRRRVLGDSQLKSAEEEFH